jgi:hypothetical protein
VQAERLAPMFRIYALTPHLPHYDIAAYFFEGGGITLPRNIGNYVQELTASYSRRKQLQSQSNILLSLGGNYTLKMEATRSSETSAMSPTYGRRNNRRVQQTSVEIRLQLLNVITRA